METGLVAAWSELHQSLKTFVYRKVGDRNVADDIIQDTFLKAQTKLGQLNDTKKMSAWIHQIARHTIIDHFRKKSKVIMPNDLDWESSEHYFNDCVAYCLSKLMKTLPEKYRVVLELTEVKDLSQHEVARELNLSHSGARSRVQRARKMLKDKMSELFHIETDAYGNILICENRDPYCCRSCTGGEQRC